MATNNEMWVMFGREEMQYDHVGSPRFYYQDFWGEEEFKEEAACEVACQKHFKENFPKFLILYPRKVSERIIRP